MKSHGIEAPRKPRGENHAVTIANQEKQIQLLIDRCEVLQKERDELALKAVYQMGDIMRMQDDVAHYKLTFENMNEARLRMVGWQDCAREMLGQLPPFTAPGA